MFAFILHILGNSLALFVAARFIQGVSLRGDLFALLLAGLILGLLNITIKPIVKILSAPLILLTLGLFIVIINFFMLWLLQFFIEDFVITGFWAYFWTLAIVSGVNYLLHAFIEPSSS